jgi:endonuclease YncB( thermonuclease family)
MPSRQRDTDGSSSPGPLRRLKPWRNVLLMLVALSLFQYLSSGEITWHRDLISSLTEDAGWRKATDQVEKLGEHREGNPVPAFDIHGRVVGVLDGDSILVLDSAGHETTVRLFGIDAPEKGQPHADRARSALTARLRKQTVGVVVQDEDRYGRSVGTVYLKGDNINLAMVERGHAWWYRKYAPHERLLEVAERRARADALGLWSKSDPTPPWAWRARQRANR